MIEYRLLFPEQYDIVKYVKGKQLGKEMQLYDLDKIDPYIEGMIKEVITKDMIKNNFAIKWSIFDHACYDKKLTRTEICNKHGKKSSKEVTDLLNLFMESKFCKILGFPPRVKRILKEITDNPKVCMALLRSEVPDCYKWEYNNKLEGSCVQTISFKLFNSIENGEVFALSGVEKEMFLKMIFGEEFPSEDLFQEEKSKWKDFYFKILHSNSIFDLNKNKEHKAEDTKAEEAGSLVCNENSDEVIISEYLSRFCHNMVINKCNNPILHTKESDKKGYYKNKKRREDTWEDLNEEEKDILCRCYIIRDYIKKKSDINPENLLNGYYNFVIRYLKELANDLIEDHDKRLDLYLFEQVFGFSYINSIAKILQEKCKKYGVINLEIGPWEEMGVLLGRIMENFEPCMRNEIAEKIIDAFFYERFFNEGIRNYETYAGWGVEFQENEERNRMYFMAMDRFLCDCRSYISKEELSIKIETKIEKKWDKDVIDLESYNEILNYKDITKEAGQ